MDLRITHDMLVQRRACAKQRQLFLRTFPDGIEVTMGNALAYCGEPFLFDWLPPNLLSADRMADYAALARCLILKERAMLFVVFYREQEILRRHDETHAQLVELRRMIAGFEGDIDEKDDEIAERERRIDALVDRQEADQRAIAALREEVAGRVEDVEEKNGYLNRIHDELDSEEWDASTLDRIAAILREAGYHISEPREDDEPRMRGVPRRQEPFVPEPRPIDAEFEPDYVGLAHLDYR